MPHRVQSAEFSLNEFKMFKVLSQFQSVSPAISGQFQDTILRQCVYALVYVGGLTGVQGHTEHLHCCIRATDSLT